MRKAKVLFLCTGNSAHSQMAEGFLRHLADVKFDVYSAVVNPTQVNPLAIKVMDEVHGGHGYCRDFSIERYYRDARGLTLHFKTTELLRVEIAKVLIGV